MNKKLGVISKVYKCEIKGCLFYRILYFNKLGEVISTIIYQYFNMGEESTLKKVFPDSVNRDYLNKLSLDTSYEELPELEAKKIIKLLENQEIEVFDLKDNKDIEFFNTKNICGTQYLLTKNNKLKFYHLTEVVFNEHKVASYTKATEPVVLPYILMELLEEYKLVNKTFQVFDGTFIRFQKRNGNYYVLTYSLSPNEENKLILSLVWSYYIVEVDGIYEIVNDEQNITNANLTIEDIAEISKELLTDLDLKTSY